ncbi:LysR family transcriptional regulator [Jiella sp. MQZ9-1]|uniref:LysR family transcriptional regulator n=1 Tax=Jiella flava TaxID=2816857 RepID=A0A939FUU3_9HYPH|nr:LysR substrate-binding domain-containing protein [Jiella flava]MBO0661932.1 LysR family transcriptional regulator [Jiella flava]MCD2470740.1 LysR family transcriptional regulator [Jiella flava]
MRRAYTPTIGELEAFRALAEAGSATRAGQTLGLTQSAISRSLQSLEERLGVRLFHRVRRRLILSDAGRSFLRDADRILAELDGAALTVMSFGGREKLLRLVALPTFASAWLIPRLAGFAALAPDITVDVTSALQPVDFSRAPADAAIQRLELRSRGAEAIALLDESLIVVASPRIVGDSGDLPDEALATLPLIQQATRPDLWLRWFQEAQLDAVRILRGPRFEHFGMVLAAARAGLGAALVPAILVEEEIATGRLVRASSQTIDGGSPYALIFPPQQADNASFRRFRDWLVAEAGGGPVPEDPETPGNLKPLT